jgi:C4-dicarboxylate-specific signal transduction histidine kinase
MIAEVAANSRSDVRYRSAHRDGADEERAANEVLRLRDRVSELETRLHKRNEQRRAMIHIMGELNKSNRRLADQRKAMLHILCDYEKDRSRLGRQADRLDNSRRALLHILQDVHRTNQRLENSRKAMLHIMGDLRETTEAIQRREQELREKQDQLVQAAKLATLGELTTGVAHELNNPLNNIGLFVGNAIDLLQMNNEDGPAILRELRNTMLQVRKATAIISHLRTFGRAAHVSRVAVCIKAVVLRSISLMQEQLRLRQVQLDLDLPDDDPNVIGNAIRLEQVFINLLTNARDAVAEVEHKRISVSCRVERDTVLLLFEDSGPGIPPNLHERIFDPFFTTKQVGSGTGLGLSITYGIITDHGGTISVVNRPKGGAAFLIRLPLAPADGKNKNGKEYLP